MNRQNTRKTPFVNAPTRKTVQWICKTQCPKAQNTMNILRSQTVKAQESFLHCALALFAVVCSKSQNGTMNRQNSINILGYQSVRSQECFLLLRLLFTILSSLFCVLKSWMPWSAKYNEHSSSSSEGVQKQFVYCVYTSQCSFVVPILKSWMPQSAKFNEYFSFWKRGSP